MNKATSALGASLLLALHSTTCAADMPLDAAVAAGTAAMIIAGADGVLADSEFQYLVDNQNFVSGNVDQYVVALRVADWKSADLAEVLGDLRYAVSNDARVALLDMANAMSSADGDHHEQEKAAANRASMILGL